MATNSLVIPVFGRTDLSLISGRINYGMNSFQNITIANPFKEENNIWAVCYFGREGDKKNMLTLDKDKISIVKNGKKDDYDITDMQQASKGHKRLLLPLIIGGVVSPLSIIAIYENTLSPFILLAVLFAGLMLLYIGQTGSEVLIFQHSKGKEEYVFLKSIPDHVVKFLFFLNMFLAQKWENQKGPLFYHQFDSEENGDSPNFSKAKGTGDGYILLTQEEFKKAALSADSDQKFISIDPLKLSAPIRLKNFENGSSHFITDTIDHDSIKDMI